MNHKTKQQIILETVEYYESDPIRRGILASNGHCAYATPTGTMCAIGRLLTDAGLKAHYLDYSTPAGAIKLEYIRPEYRDAIADPKFVTDLQHLHDEESYWDDEGLTDEGKQALSDMLDRWSN